VPTKRCDNKSLGIWGAASQRAVASGDHVALGDLKAQLGAETYDEMVALL
jgi:hypothetical protein